MIVRSIKLKVDRREQSLTSLLNNKFRVSLGTPKKRLTDDGFRLQPACENLIKMNGIGENFHCWGLVQNKNILTLWIEFSFGGLRIWGFGSEEVINGEMIR
jgi:hypothetical protein